MQTERSAFLSYGLGALSSAFALILWIAFGGNLEPSPFPLVIAAVVVSAWYGGRGPGIAAAAIGAFGSAFFYFSPQYSLAIDSARGVVQLAVFLLVAVFVTVLTTEQRQARRDRARLLESEHEARVTAESTQRTLQAVITASPLPIVSFDRDGHIQTWNPAAERLFGWKEEEVLGHPLASLPGDEEDLFRARAGRLLAGETIQDIQARRRRRDGSLVDVSISASPLFDQEGRATGWVSLYTDMTAHRRMEEGLRFLSEASVVLSSSLDYETTLASVAKLAVPQVADWCTVHIVEEDGSVRQLAVEHVDPAKMDLARALEQRYPFDPQAPGGVPEALRHGRSELIPEITDEMLVTAIGDDPELLEIVRDLGLRSSMVVPLIARDRTLGAMSFAAAESERRFTPDDLTVAEDLARRAALAVDNARLYRESLRVAAEQSAILAQMADGILMANPDGQVTYVNEAARRILGLPAIGEMSLRDFARMVPMFMLDGQSVPPDESALGHALRGETSINLERRVRRADGREIVTQSSAAPVVAEDGTHLGAVSAFRDVTVQYELARQKDEFLSSIAHDLKTPLTTIKGMAQVLRVRARRAGTPETEALLDGLRTMDVTATRMTRLINQLLDAARVQMGRPFDLNLRRMDLAALARRIVDERRKDTRNHRLCLEVATPQIVGMWDEDRLERVLNNLLLNAIKFSPEGGDVLVKVWEDQDGSRSYAVITVEDQGLGIPSVDLPHIFERFYRARNVQGKIPGTGIGLAGVQQIVAQHGGEISVESQEGKGARFTVRLPTTVSSVEVTREGISHG